MKNAIYKGERTFGYTGSNKAKSISSKRINEINVYDETIQ